MLNQDERRRFNDIAHHLTTDRRFARQVRTDAQTERRTLATVSMLCTLLMVIAPTLALLGGWMTVPPTLGAFMVILAAVLLRRRPQPNE